MLKRGGSILKVVLRLSLLGACLTLPVLAYAWSLSTRVLSTGGSLQVGTHPPETVVNGTVTFSNLTTHQNVPVTLTATPGYLISHYVVNGSDTYPATSISSATYQMGLIAFPGTTSQVTTASFAKWLTPITVKTGDFGGSVSPSGTLNQQYTTNISYVITPYTGGQVMAIRGLPASGYTISPAIPANIGIPVTLTLTIPATPLTIECLFNGVDAVVGAPQTALAGSTVTLDGSGSTVNTGGGTLTYDWAQVDGLPKVTLSDSKAAKPTFSTSTVGVYKFALTVTSNPYTNSATAQVIVTNSAAAAARATCQTCHISAGVGISTNVFGNWSSSSHEQKVVMCAYCHVGADTGGHPGTLAGSVDETTFIYKLYSANAGSNFCFTCHHKANNLHYNTEAQLANICVACHTPNVHDPAATMLLSVGHNHFNGYTSSVNPSYGAAYVTPTTQCANCHITANGTPDAANDPSLLQERTDWAASGHGNTKGAGFIGNDFKTLSGCVQCHTANGFIAYSSAKVTNAWGSASDQTRNVLSCNGCHKDVGTGAVRSAAPVHPYANDPYANPDLAGSNLCMKCHSGTQSGRAIKAQSAANADFSNLAFTGSHASAATGIVMKSIGYEFAFKSYSNSVHFKHDKIGKNHFKAYGYDSGSDGPCIGCHMTSANKHSFLPVSKDSNGNITSVGSASCAGCHTGPAYLDAGRMNSRKTKLAASLLALQKVLETRGIYYADVAPYFFKSAGSTDPGNAVTNWGNADVMGATFNFNLLQHEPGAYAHNMIYAKRLIYDSIDFLDNGALDNSVSAAIDGLATLNATQKATAKGYLAPTGTRP